MQFYLQLKVGPVRTENCKQSKFSSIITTHFKKFLVAEIVVILIGMFVGLQVSKAYQLKVHRLFLEMWRSNDWGDVITVMGQTCY